MGITEAEKSVNEAVRRGQILASEAPKYIYMASRDPVGWQKFLGTREALNDGTFVAAKKPIAGLTKQELAMCSALGVAPEKFVGAKKAWTEKVWNDTPRDVHGRPLNTNEVTLARAAGK